MKEQNADGNGVSETELAGLSPEEQAALGAEDDDADELEALAGEGADDTNAGAGADAATAGGDAPAGAEVAATGAGGDAADEDEIIATAPIYAVEQIADYDQKSSDLDRQFTELQAKLKAGDIDVTEFVDQNSKLQADRSTLERAKMRSEIGQDFNAATGRAAWQTTINVFLRDTKRASGVDYRKDTVVVGGKEVKVFNELDRMVKALGNDPANNERSREWFLQEAHAIVSARYGLGKKTAPAGKAAAEGGAAVKGKPQARRPDLRGVPNTLSGVPASADDAGTGGGEFDQLDKLSGMELENAIARMSPEQQQRFARG